MATSYSVYVSHWAKYDQNAHNMCHTYAGHMVVYQEYTN